LSNSTALKRIQKIDIRAYVQSLGATLPLPQDVIDGEELIFERILRPAFLKLGYESSDLTPKPSLTAEIIGERREVDWGVYNYESILQGERFAGLYGIVVDVKKHGVELDQRLVEKVAGYCALFNSKYGVLANDEGLVILKPTKGVIDWDYLTTIPIKSDLVTELQGRGRPTYSVSDRIQGIRYSTLDLDEKIIEGIVTDCNNIIRRRKGLWGKERQYEFSKLLLLRIQDEREFIEGDKNSLQITYEEIRNLSERGVNLHNYVNSLFQPLAQRSGIFPANEQINLNDGVIEETIQVLDVHALWLKRIEILGQVYERFLMRTMTGKELGEYFTPRSLVNLTVDMVDPTFGQKILDPACGTGGFLVYSLLHIQAKEAEGKKAKPCKFYGIEIDEYTQRLSKINSWLHNDSHENIIKANSRDPKQTPPFLIDALRNPERDGFECILTNPPFGATGKNRIGQDEMRTDTENWKSMGVNLFECGATGKGAIPQVAFLELCVKALKKPTEPLKGGRLGTVIDVGIFNNIRSEEPLARRILRRETIIEAIIGLPNGSFKMYASNVIPAILILRRKHDSEKQGAIFRADIQKIGYIPSATRFRLNSNEHIDQLIPIWNKWSKSKGIR
jgi:type I restriction enzyme M protein